MLELKDGEPVSANVDDKVNFCPVCENPVQTAFPVAFGKGGKWAWCRCGCGTVFSAKGQDVEKARKENDELGQDFNDGLVVKALHPFKTYLPIIEEIAPAGRFLGIGQRSRHALEWVKDRGWITYGETERVDDGSKMAVIWLEHEFHRFDDWKERLEMFWHRLDHGGILYLDMPDTTCMSIYGIRGFPHLIPWEGKILWRMETFCALAPGLGWDVVMARRNEQFRCLQFAMMQVILKKRG